MADFDPMWGIRIVGGLNLGRVDDMGYTDLFVGHRSYHSHLSYINHVDNLGSRALNILIVDTHYLRDHYCLLEGLAGVHM